MSNNALSASANPSAERASENVVTAVARAKNVDQTELPPLYHAIDPDDLDKLFQSGFQSSAGNTAVVQFTFAGCDVVVDGENGVTATPTDSGTERELEA